MMAMRASALLYLVLLQCGAIVGARIPGIKLPSQRQEILPEALLNSRPLIGVLSQPGDGEEYQLTSRPLPPDYNTSYIAASYVKFVEMGGARAVPLIWNEPEETLRKVSPSTCLRTRILRTEILAWCVYERKTQPFCGKVVGCCNWFSSKHHACCSHSL